MKKGCKLALRISLGIVASAVILLGSYLAYVALQYYRIEDNTILTIEKRSTTSIQSSTKWKALTYNIGFGAYSPDFSFFLDEGVMKDGRSVVGKNAKAKSKAVTLKNTQGAIDSMLKVQPDILFLQEVDVKADRSHQLNQYQMIKEAFPNYDAVYSSNFHSAYLCYPLQDFIGQTESGIVTLTSFSLEQSIRRSFPVDLSFPTKFFDLDRCFSVSTVQVENRDVHFINIHMSAYDAGGKIRAKQLAMLNSFLGAEIAKGNSFVLGGDFNHDVADTIDHYFPSQQEIPTWVHKLNAADIVEGANLFGAKNAPTCRSSDMPYTKNVNYTVSIDGFITSSDIVVHRVETIDLDFAFSDHNPVLLEFSLQ